MTDPYGVAERPLVLWIAVLLVGMLGGRAMTLWFLPQLGSDAVGAPPDAWLMPLVGDAVVGVCALPVAILLWRGGGLGAWTSIVAWNVVGVWDALSAFLVHLSAPWPEFFMLQLFGPVMFFMASAMHTVVLIMVAGPLRARFVGSAISGSGLATNGL